MGIGIEQKQFYRITSTERTLLECLRLSSKIGLSIVLKAIRKTCLTKLPIYLFGFSVKIMANFQNEQETKSLYN